MAAPVADTAVGARSRTWLPLAAAVVSIGLWASAFVGIRAAGRAFSPGALALGRLTLGSILLGALLLTRGWTRPSRRDLGLLLIAGLLWFGLYNVVLNAAEQRVDAGTAAMLINIAPIFIVILAAVFLHERFAPALLVGGAVAFAGVAGVILCLVAALACAAGVVAQKPVLARLPAIQVTWLCCTIGALVCLPYAPALVRDVQAAPASGVAWMAYLGAFPTSIAFTTWAYALARGTAGRTAAMTYLVPAVTILLSWLILGEVPGLVAVLGGALCLVGVYIARRTPKTCAAVGGSVTTC